VDVRINDKFEVYLMKRIRISFLMKLMLISLLMRELCLMRIWANLLILLS
jgi:hypothetical protein